MRPQCKACGRYLPTIDGFCAKHISLTTQMALYTIAAETVLFFVELDALTKELTA